MLLCRQPNLHLLTVTVWQTWSWAPSLGKDHEGWHCVSENRDKYTESYSIHTLLDPLNEQSPPAALSLESPACWSLTPSFHLLPSSLKSPSVLFSPSLPPCTFSSCSSCCLLLNALQVSRSPAKYSPCWCSLLRAGDSLWAKAEKEWGRSLQCRATLHSSGLCMPVWTVCVHI